MSSAPKFTSMEGPRFTKAGEARYRPYTKQRGRKIFGPWGTAAEGKAWQARQTLVKLEGGDIAPQRGQTLEAASATFLDGIEDGTILSRKDLPYAHSTVRGYRYAFRDFINPELGHIAVNKLRRSQVQRWVDFIAIKQGAGTTRNVFHALAALYSHILPRYDDLIDPTEGVRIPRPGKSRERYAQPAEIRELMAALPLRLALPYAFAFYAGLRRGEIQALRVEDVEGEWAHVRRTLDRVEGFKLPKNGRVRQVPVFEPLRPYLEFLPESGQIFPNRAPSRWGVLDFSPLAAQAAAIWRKQGLAPIGFHEGRHSFATALVRAGYDIALVSEWVGHGNAATTLTIYVKPRGQEEGLAERMNTFLGA